MPAGGGGTPPELAAGDPEGFRGRLPALRLVGGSVIVWAPAVLAVALQGQSGTRAKATEIKITIKIKRGTQKKRNAPANRSAAIAGLTKALGGHYCP